MLDKRKFYINGKWIDPVEKNDFEVIYEPLSRLDYAEKQCIDGMGIGLSIVKMLVERMEINIQLKSTLNKGSTFTLIFRG